MIQAVRQFCNGMSGFPLEDPLIEGFTLGIGLKNCKEFPVSNRLCCAGVTDGC